MASTGHSVRKLAMLQLLLITATSVIFLMINGAFQAASVWCGGLIAMANVLLLEWRRRRADSGPALSAGESLRLLYRSAVERFVLVLLLFAVALGTLQLDPLALITGFIVGQLALVFKELIKTE